MINVGSTSWQAHGIVKRKRSNRRFQRASPPGQSSAAGGDPGHFGGKKLEMWVKKYLNYAMSRIRYVHSIYQYHVYQNRIL